MNHKSIKEMDVKPNIRYINSKMTNTKKKSCVNETIEKEADIYTRVHTNTPDSVQNSIRINDLMICLKSLDHYIYFGMPKS